MIEHESLRCDGLFTYWTLGSLTCRESLRLGFEAAGFAERVPPERPARSCLRDALTQVFRGHKCDVKRLKEDDAFEVTQLNLGDMQSGNLYTPLLRAKVLEATGTIRLRWVNPHVDPALYEPHILTAYNRQLGYLKPQQVAEALVNVLAGLDGIRLRPTGGIYWLSQDHAERWRQVALAAEQAAVDCRHSVYLLRHKMDADAVRAVRDAVILEITAEAERIDREVSDPESTLGNKALEARQREALELRRKIRVYEDLLGEGLGVLRESVEKAHDAAAQAALLASVAEVA